MATNGPTNHTDQYQPNAAVAPAAPAVNDDPQNPDIPKDEVAWFFVEQYYTTLSKSPEKLHLFYSKRSQFVYGQEGQTANVSVGRQSIQDRIKSLEFQNCKVRVSNVDSQSSFDNIVIQVIGETSNNAGDLKKFAQTFVLARQPLGYFVLNDILRFIDDEAEEQVETVEQAAQPVEAEAPVPAAEEVKEAEPVEAESVPEQPAAFDPEVVDNKLEEASAEAQVASTNGNAVAESAAEGFVAVPEVVAETVDVATPDPETAAQEVAEEAVEKAEKPQEPTPTPAVTRQAASPAVAPAVAVAPAQPAKPMTWASRAAAAAGPQQVSPAMPLPKAAPVPIPIRPAAAVVAAAAAAAAAPAPAQAPVASPQLANPVVAAASKEAGAEWQTAGGDSKRQGRPQTIPAPVVEKEGTLAYVKYVTEKVQREDLYKSLKEHGGEMSYFDVNRAKNCAFVEFATAAGCQAAIAANPHVIAGENVIVEPRRPKTAAYGGSGYNAGRGNAHNRGGRGGFDGGRSGSHNTRGSFGGQNRGGRGGLGRTRGASQSANA